MFPWPRRRPTARVEESFKFLGSAVSLDTLTVLDIVVPGAVPEITS